MFSSHKIFRKYGLIAAIMGLSVAEVKADDKTPAKPVHDAAPSGIQTKTLIALEHTLSQSIQFSQQEAISQWLVPEKIPVAALSPEATEAKALFDELELKNRILPALTNNTLQDLPVAIPLGKNTACYLAIKKAVFRSTHVELEVYARLTIGEEELYFGNKTIRYVMSEGLAGTAHLALLGNQEISNAQYLLQFTGGTAGAALNVNTTHLKINCGNFEGLVLKGKIEFNKETFLPLDNKGYPVDNGKIAVSSAIDFQTDNLNQLYIPLKNGIAFTLKKSQAIMGFSLKAPYIDLSDASTPASLNALLGNFLTPNTTDSRNQWTGLYAEKTVVYLPLYFYPATNKDPEPVRPSYESTALVMDASGIYMNSTQTNVAKWDKMGGSPMTIDRIQFNLQRSSYISFSMKGKIGVLVAKSPFKDKSDKSYNFDNLSETEYIKYKGSLDDKSENFALKVEPQNSMNFMGAKSTLRQDSQVVFSQDSPTYRSTTLELDSLGNSNPSNPTLPDISETTIDKKHAFLARLVTPRLSFRYIIGKDLSNNKVTHDDQSSNTKNLLTLGVVLVENLKVGYSFFGKKPIFSFTRIGYEQMGKIPVFHKIGLRKLMATYDEAEKICEVNFAFYANHNPADATAASKNKDESSDVLVLIDMSLNFAMEVTDEKTEASFDSFSLNNLYIKGSVAGFNVTGALDFLVDDEEYGTACVGNLLAECQIKGVKKITTTDDSPARISISWIVGAKEENGTEYGYTYFDGMFSFGESGPLLGSSVRLNGFGFGVSVNMIQSGESGSRHSLTGRKFVPKKKAGGFLLAATFIDASKTQRGYIGIYAEFEKGGGYNGFRKLSIYGSWDILRDANGIEELTVQKAIANTTTATNNISPAATATSQQKKQVQGQNYAAQVNNALKLLDVPLDDKFALFKFNLDFDCSTDDFIMEGNVFGFMHYNLKDDGSYIRGAADDQGLGYLGMIAFKAQIKNGAVAGNKNAKDKNAKVDYKDSKGYFWIGRPDEPLAIEAAINVGSVDSPKYLKFGATLFMVGGNAALPTNVVKYYSTVENAKTQINQQLQVRGDKPIHWDLPPSVTIDGNGYFAFGLSIGGQVELGSKESAKVGVYFNASFGFGMNLAYSQILSCNDTHFLGSAIVHGSGELGLRINIANKQTRFSIIKGSFAIGGVGDGKDSYGAGMFEYSLLGGIVEGRAFGKFGAPFCLEPKQFDLNTNLNLVESLSPDSPIFKIEPNAEATFNGEVALNEMIILKLNPAIAVYEKCNIVIDGKDTLTNVAIVANYALYKKTDGTYKAFDNVMRWKEKRKNRQDDEIRFVGKKREKITKRGPKSALWWYANIHAPYSEFELKLTLIITDDNNIQFGDGDRKWEKIGDFEQKFTFRFKTGARLVTEDVSKDNDYYIRNL
jgi:hypothetical protein